MGTAPDCTDGIVQYAVRDVFEKRRAFHSEGKQVSIEMSYMEIYMEECFDLLSSLSEKKKVELRENSRGETYVDGLSQRLVHSPEDVANLINHACKTRSVSKTAMNAHSSRSHAICTITVRVVTSEDAFVAKLNLVDLAGSERAKKTMATGDILQEGININKGLLALGNVVSALSTKGKQNSEKVPGKVATNAHVHVPYRESKLTRLLKDSLGGNGMTALLACVSPSTSDCDETINTLRFASRASSIVNIAKVNHEDKNVVSPEVIRLREQLAALQEKYEASVQEKEPRLSLSNAFAQDSAEMIAGSARLISSYKSLVMHCFMEDISLNDGVLQKIKEEITTAASLFGFTIEDENENQLSDSLLEDCEMSALMDIEDLNAFNCVPPIAVVLDRLTSLEGHFKKCLQKASKKPSSTSISAETAVASTSEPVEAETDQGGELNDEVNDSDLSNILRDAEDISVLQAEEAVNCSDEMLILSPILKPRESSLSAGSEMDMDDSFERRADQVDQMQNKFVRVANLGRCYEDMISKLTNEINGLQNENMRLQTESSTKASLDSNGTDDPKLKAALRQRAKELDEKIKLLRKRECELAKIQQTKERLTQQLNQKQAQLITCKRDKVKMAKRMQEKEAVHRVETNILVKNDVQARQRATRAEATLAKLTRDMSSKEKVWQSKLDAKKMEMERLKLLLQKREDVKRVRAGGLNRHNSAVVVQGGASMNAEMRRRFQEVLAAETKVAKYNGAIQFHLQQKRNLQQERLFVRQKRSKLRQSSPLYKQLDEECQQLDVAINKASSRIAQMQLQLDEAEALINGDNAANKASNFKEFLQQTLIQSLPADSTRSCREDVKYCLQTLWDQHRQCLQTMCRFETEADERQQLISIERVSMNERSFDKQKKQFESDHEDDGSALDDTFYPSDDNDSQAGAEASDGSESSDYDSDAAPRKRKRVGAKGSSEKQGSSYANKRSRRVSEDLDESAESADSDVKETKKPKARTATIAAKFSFVSADAMEDESTDHDEHHLLQLVRAGAVSLQDIMTDDNHYAFAHELYDLIPAQFNLAKVEVLTEESGQITLLISASADYKRAFTTSEPWKIQLPLSFRKTAKMRDEAWAKMKTSLLMIFVAIARSVCAEETSGSAEFNGCKPHISGKADRERVLHYLEEQQMKGMDRAIDFSGLEPYEFLQCILLETTVAKKQVVVNTEEIASATAGDSIDESSLLKCTVKELKTFLVARGLPVSGAKKELIARLIAFGERQITTESESAEMIVVNVEEDPSEDQEPAEAVSSERREPLLDRNNWIQSLSALKNSVSEASKVALSASMTDKVTAIPSKRSFRLNLDELTEELENSGRGNAGCSRSD